MFVLILFFLVVKKVRLYLSIVWFTIVFVMVLFIGKSHLWIGIEIWFLIKIKVNLKKRGTLENSSDDKRYRLHLYEAEQKGFCWCQEKNFSHNLLQFFKAIVLIVICPTRMWWSVKIFTLNYQCKQRGLHLRSKRMFHRILRSRFGFKSDYVPHFHTCI